MFFEQTSAIASLTQGRTLSVRTKMPKIGMDSNEKITYVNVSIENLCIATDDRVILPLCGGVVV